MATIAREARASSPALGGITRAVTWPVIGLVVTGALHFTMEVLWPDIRASFTAPVVTPVLLAYGAWLGYRLVGAGTSYPISILAAAFVGLLPVALEVFGFGIILGRGVDAGIVAGAFNFSIVVFGSLIGAGFARDAEASA